MTTGELVGVPPRSSSHRWTWVAAVALAAITGAIGYQLAQRGVVVPAAPPTRSTLIVPHNLYPRAPSQRFALSPDGRRLAYVGLNADGGNPVLFVRPLEGGESQVLAGTDGAASPFWSPDSRAIAFFANGDLKRIDAGGGSTVTISRGFGPATPNTGSWNRDDVILVSRNNVIARVAAGGGELVAVTAIDGDRETAHDMPVFLPDGQHFVYAAYHGLEPTGTFVAPLAGGAATQLLSNTANAMYTNGFLLFVRDDALLAQRFDPARRELSGEAMTIAEGVLSNGMVRVAAAFSASHTGSLVYQSTAGSWHNERLVWATRDGVQSAIADQPSHYRHLALSPDGSHLAITLLTDGGLSDVWILNLARGQRTRITFDGKATGAIWLADGRSVLLTDGSGQFRIKQADGGGDERRIAAPAGVRVPLGISPDGRTVLFEQLGGSANNTDLWTAMLDGSRKAEPVLAAAASERWGQLSPDGKWIAYTTDESARREVYLARVGASGRWQVSTNSGSYPRWSRDGRELFFWVATSSKLAAAKLQFQGDAVAIGEITPLFDVRAPDGFARYFYDVAPDGRFVMAGASSPENGAEITLLTNWPQLLRAPR